MQKEDEIMKWMFIIVISITLSLNGCADTADAEDSTATTPAEQQEANEKSASGDTTWIAIVMTWNPVNYTIDKEFTSEVECWNYYDTGVGEIYARENFGTQVLDHQGNKPDKEYHKKHRPSHREYPTRLYKGADGWSRGLIWLTCDIKGK